MSAQPVAFVGLDLATHDWGVVALDGSGPAPIEIGNPQRKAKAKRLGDRLVAIQAEVVSVVEALLMRGYGVVVGAEALPTQAAYALGLLGEVHGAVRVELAKRFGLEMEEVPLSTARKFTMAENMPPSAGAKVVIRNAVKGRDGWSGVAGWASAGPDAVDAFIIAAFLAGKAGGMQGDWRPRRLAFGDGERGEGTGARAASTVRPKRKRKRAGREDPRSSSG